MRCIGTLEFLCDFYERCHLTQKELSEASQNEVDKEDKEESDLESDKENTIPTETETTKQYKKEKTKERMESDDNTNDVQTNSKIILPLNPITTNIQPMKGNVVSNEQIQNNHKNMEDDLKPRLLVKKENVSRNSMLRTRRSMNDINPLQKKVITVNLNSEVRRKRGRKSRLENLKKNSLVNVKKEMTTALDDQNNGSVYNGNKRQCLKTICSNAKSSVINSVISSKPQFVTVESREPAELVKSFSSDIRSKEKEINIVYSKDMVDDKSKKSESEGKNVQNEGDNSKKNRRLSAVVKQENMRSDCISPTENEKSNQLVWIPNEMLSPEGKDSFANRNYIEVVYKKTERLKQDREVVYKVNDGKIKQVFHENIDTTNSSNCDDTIKKVFNDQNRVTITDSSNSVQSQRLANEETIIKRQKLDISLDLLNQSADSTVDCIVDECSTSLKREISQHSTVHGNKNLDKSFRKISELISDEEKEIIESYYTVDMSMVNSKEVESNITILDKKNMRCNICGSLYLRMDKCQVHIWGHLQMKPYQCSVCDFATVTVSNVRCHIRKSHLKIKPFACHICEKRYITAVLLAEHINTHTGERPYKCKHCDFASSSRQSLNYHKDSHKPVKDINCKICGKEFYSRGRLRAHMIVHNKDKIVVCKVCSAYLSSPEALETHYKNFHLQDYVCNICGKHMKSRKALHNHQNVHAAAKYKCTLCPNVYKSSQILKEHLLKHEGIRKYQCNICEKKFGQQSHLAAHMAVHSKIRFHCPGCDKPFNRHDNMKIHTKRCKLFLANPELKNLLTRRQRTTSFNNVKESAEELKNENQATTSINVCKLGVNISCLEPANETWDQDIYTKKEEITTSAEVNVIKLANIDDKLILENDKLSLMENVLEPERY